MIFLSTEEIRKNWILFFKSKDHYELPYSSLVPINDNSILWINSGVATLKSFFDGSQNPPSNRLVNSQKSIRTNDINNVGYTTRHHTLFEMLGNFSIGDYFKKEAIEFAWEFLTSSKWLNLDQNKLYITVYENDLEAYKIWTNNIRIPKNRIIKGTKETNFWEIGLGPCGPNTEIYYDRGSKYDPENIGLKLLKEDIENNRYLEIWNIVFSEFNSKGNGKYAPLPRKNIDTGAGLERLATIIQNVPTSFDIDIFQKIIKSIEKITLNKFIYEINNYFTKDITQENINICFKIISDHIRAIVFTIADNVYPHNKGRGYVIRKLIRRALVYGNKLNINEPFLYKLVKNVANTMGDYYSYLSTKIKLIEKIVHEEEIKFLKTLVAGKKTLLEFIEKHNNLTTENAFLLFETFGFPFDLTQEICKEYNIHLDNKKFIKYLDNHKENARKQRKHFNAMNYQNTFINSLKLQSEFVGYNNYESKSKIIAILGKNKTLMHLENSEGYIVFDKTPFYAEKGGQAADIGDIYQNKTLIGKVKDVQLGPNNEYIHYVDINGDLSVNDTVILKINKVKRNYTKKNHSGTHILHSALRKILSTNILPIGSFNNENYLRIDFSYNKKVTSDQIKEINNLANTAIKNSISCKIINTTFDNAVNKIGALAFFEDKYNKSNVRIIKFDDFSIELCGGTHVNNTKEIEEILVTKFTSIGNNIYRVNALTSQKTIKSYLETAFIDLEEIYKEVKLLQVLVNDSKDLSYLLNLQNMSSFDKVKTITKNIDLLLKFKSKLNKIDAHNKMNIFLKEHNDLEINFLLNHRLIIHTFFNKDIKFIRSLVDYYQNKYLNNLIIIFNNIVSDKKAILVLSISKDLISKYDSSKIIQKISKILDGKGGGNKKFSQIGYNNLDKFKEITNNLEHFLLIK